MAVIPDKNSFVDPAGNRQRDLAIALAGRRSLELGYSLFEIGAAVAAQISRAPSQIPFQEPIRVDLRRVPRAELPTDRAAFKTWLDDAWLELDQHAPPGR